MVAIRLLRQFVIPVDYSGMIYQPAEAKQADGVVVSTAFMLVFFFGNGRPGKTVAKYLWDRSEMEGSRCAHADNGERIFFFFFEKNGAAS